MMFALLLAVPAFAEPFADTAADAAPCEPAGVAAIRPYAGQVDVPVNVVPGLVWDGACAPADHYTVSLLDGETELASETLDFPGNFAVSHLDPGGELLPDHAYVFRITPEEGRGVVTEAAFTTGTGLAAPLVGTPVLSYNEAVGDDVSHAARLWFDLDAPPEPNDLSLWQARDGSDPDQVWSAGAITDGFVTNTATVTPWGPAEDVCLVPVVYDALGTALTGEEACVAPQGGSVLPIDCGCNAPGGGVPLTASVGALAALSCLRRRSAGSPGPTRTG